MCLLYPWISSAFAPPVPRRTEIDLIPWSKTMSDMATTVSGRPPAADLLDKKMKKSHAMISTGVVLAALIVGIGFIGFHIAQDFSGVNLGSIWPYLLFLLALAIALGFEFVN